jgi:hypothetical protein
MLVRMNILLTFASGPICFYLIFCIIFGPDGIYNCTTALRDRFLWGLATCCAVKIGRHHRFSFLSFYG